MTTVTTVRFLDRSSPPHILTLVLLAGLGAASLNIFLPSLPSMAADYGADPSVVALAVPVYLAMNAALQLVIGPVSDRYGRRPVMLWCIAIFLLATLGIILAPTIELFLLFRLMQAVIVAGLVVGRAVVRDMVSNEAAASMIGYVTMGMALVPMIAPFIGGTLDEAFGWRASFWFLAAMGAVCLALCWTDMGETAQRQTASFRDQIRGYPELLRSQRFWGYCFSSAFASGAFFAYLGGAPFIATSVYGLTPAQVGLYFGAPAVGYAIGNFVSGRYSQRVGLNRMVLTGTAITLTGLTVLLLIQGFLPAHPVVFFGFCVSIGLGNGFVIPNATAGMLQVRPQLAGAASGLGGAIMIGGGAVLSALAARVVGPGSGATPLLILMCTTSALGLASVLWVIWRERHLRLA